MGDGDGSGPDACFEEEAPLGGGSEALPAGAAVFEAFEVAGLGAVDVLDSSKVF